jgi:peptide/nickel transport system substrate-binding protein
MNRSTKTPLLATLLAALLISSGFAVAPKNALVIQAISGLTSLDPHQSFENNGFLIMTNLYETLVTYEKNTSKLKPMLATAWNVSSDGKTYTFHLRQGVKFSSGNDFTCSDAEYSLRRLLVTNNATSPAFYLADAIMGFPYWDEESTKTTAFSKITDAVKCDANGKLIVKLSRREPVFLLRLTGPWGGMIDQKFSVENGEWDGTEATWKAAQGKELTNSSFNRVSSGTGAYQMVSKESDQLIFKANASYWGEKPKLQNVIFKMIAEDSARVLAIKNADADIISYSASSVVKQLTDVPGVTLLKEGNLFSSVLSFNQRISKVSKNVGSGKLDGKGIPRDFFADIHVRRGMALAFDRDRYLKEALEGNGVLRTMAISNLLPGYDATIKLPRFNLDAARNEFKLAFNGRLWKNGFVFDALTSIGTTEGITALDLLREGLAKVNPKFKLKVRSLAEADLFPKFGNGEVPLIFVGNSAEVPDGDGLVRFFYSSSGTMAVHNNFSDVQIEKLIVTLSGTEDPAKRAKLIGLIGRRAAEIVPLICLPMAPGTSIYRSELKGIENGSNQYRGTSLLWNYISKQVSK